MSTSTESWTPKDWLRYHQNIAAWQKGVEKKFGIKISSILDEVGAKQPNKDIKIILTNPDQSVFNLGFRWITPSDGEVTVDLRDYIEKS